MKMKKILAMVMALVMLLSLAACRGGGTTGDTNGSVGSDSSNTVYSVAVVDVQGNPYTENIVVKFMQNGQQVAMQNVNGEGVASKELEPGNYDVELLFTDGATYHYDAENLKLTASVTQLQVELAKVVGGATEYLFVDETEYNAPLMETGCTYVELVAGMRNYFVFVPVQSGIYEFTVHHARATVGYYGSPFYVLETNAGTASGEQSITVEIKDSMIGTGNTGTVQLVIGVDAGDKTENCVLSITRIADYVPTPEEMPWTVFVATYFPEKYTLPEGVELKDFDLTDTYNLVFNETDGYYHLNDANGPVVLVRLHAELSHGGSFGAILANANVGRYVYDEDGNFLYKELYNDCLLQYLGNLSQGMGSYSYSGGMLDDNHGVYPLTADLAYIIQSYGQYMGWWELGDGNYLFADIVNLNVEMAWLFMCCYAE